MDRLAEKLARAERLRWARKRAGYRSARDAALQNQWNENTYKTHESGVNGFLNDSGRKYASKFRVDVAWLMTGAGSPPADYSASEAELTPDEDEISSGGESMVPIVGVVRSGGLVDYSQGPGALGEAPVPSDEGEWKALRVEGNAIAPTYKDGHILYYPSARFRPDQVMNRECVVSASGLIYVRNVMRGSEPDRWHLTAPNAEALLNQFVDWASPIVWVRKGEPAAA